MTSIKEIYGDEYEISSVQAQANEIIKKNYQARSEIDSLYEFKNKNFVDIEELTFLTALKKLVKNETPRFVINCIYVILNFYLLHKMKNDIKISNDF